MNRSHLVTGRQALILPALGRTEKDIQASGPQFVTTENSMAVVQRSQGKMTPASKHLRSECAIVAGMAKATLGARPQADWNALVANYDRIRERIERVVPGFESYNERARKPGGFHLPNPVARAHLRDRYRQGPFHGASASQPALEPGQFLMTTIRTHDQFNTTIYGLDDRYRGVYNGRRVILLNEQDCREAGLAKGDVVDLTSHFRGETRTAKRFVVYPYPIPRRCAATYFPEANVLVPIDHVAEKSNTPASKSVVITLERTR